MEISIYSKGRVMLWGYLLSLILLISAIICTVKDYELACVVLIILFLLLTGKINKMVSDAGGVKRMLFEDKIRQFEMDYGRVTLEKMRKKK